MTDLNVRYGDSTALRDLSLHLAPGERCALIGANGAGKTTLLLALVGVVPAQGQVVADGASLKEPGALRQRVGLVFQNPDDQLFMPTIGQDVAFGLEQMGVPAPERQRRTEEMLQRLGIGHLRERSALSLSGGEKRMAALATVLVMEPKVLLLDEPTAFLDPGARRRLLGTLQTLPQTMLVATHDLSFALSLCPKSLLLKQGELLAQGPSRTLLFDRQTMAAAGVEDVRTFYGGLW